jgi:hypothetical protein
VANASVIRQFLVSLGWDVDQAGMNRFAGAIAVQSEAMRELGDGVKDAALKVVDFVRNLAEGLDSLYFMSGKTKASAANLDALKYAAEQTGLSFEGIASSVQGLANRITFKNGTAQLHQFGVEAKDASGKARDTVLVIQDLMREIATRPVQMQGKMLDVFGIDPQVFQAFESGAAGKFFDEYSAKLKTSGTDTDKAAADANRLMTAVRRYDADVKMLHDRIVTSLLDAWDKLSDKTKEQIASWLDLGKQLGRLAYWWDHLSATHKHAIIVALEVAAALTALVVGLAAVGVALTVVTTAFSALAPLMTIAGVILGGLDLPIVLIVGAVAGLAWTLTQVPWDEAGARANAFGKTLERIADTIGKKVRPAIANMWADLTDQGPRGDQGPIQWNGLDGAKKKVGAAVERFKAIVTDDQSPADKADDKPADQSRAALRNETRGIRNLNPANLELTPFSKEQGADGLEDTPRDGGRRRFATFPDAQTGLDAAAVLLRRYAKSGIDSVQTILSKFAPPKDNPNLPSYIASVSKRMNVSADAHLNLSDPAQLAAIERAIVQFENGKNPYSPEMYSRAARSATGNGQDVASDVTIHQTVTTTVTGAAGPQGVSSAVTGALNKGNGLLVRAVQGRTS